MEVITEIKLDSNKYKNIDSIRIIKQQLLDIKNFYTVETRTTIQGLTTPWQIDSFHKMKFQAASRSAIIVSAHGEYNRDVIINNTKALRKYEDETIETLRYKP